MHSEGGVSVVSRGQVKLQSQASSLITSTTRRGDKRKTGAREAGGKEVCCLLQLANRIQWPMARFHGFMGLHDCS